MAKRLCESMLSGWSLRAIGTVWLLCLLAPSSAQAAVGRTSGNFSVSSNGAATYSIPLWSPGGVRGLAPSVALAYSSNAGVGTVGRGWSLVGQFASSISRCARTLAQDGTPWAPTGFSGDGYCLDGNRLRLQSGTYGMSSSVYYTEVADFSKITANNGISNSSGAHFGPTSWTVQRKDGLTYTYGGTADSRVVIGAPFVAPPGVWLVSEIRDRAGNKMRFTYGSSGTEPHVTKIEWTQTSASSGSYVYSMDFHYTTGGNAATSYDMRFMAGTQLYDADLLNSVTVSTSGVVKRNYVLTYESSPTSGVKRLIQVKECSDGGVSPTDCLAPTTITYQNGAAGVNLSAPITFSGDITAAKGEFDFNGDGIKDLAYQKSGYWYVRIASLSGYGAEISTGLTALHAGRFLGNRADQLIGESGGTWHVLSFNGSSFTWASSGLSTSSMEAIGIVADFNGDGRDDLVNAFGGAINSGYSPDIYDSWITGKVALNSSSGGTPSFQTPVWIGLSTGGTPGSVVPYNMWSPPPEGGLWVYATVMGFSKGDVDGDGSEEVGLRLYYDYCVYDPADPGSGYCDAAEEGRNMKFVNYSSGGWGWGLDSTYSWGYADIVSDINRDGCADYLTSDSLYGSAVGISNCGSGIGLSLPSIWAGANLGTADWTGDGKDDYFQSDGSYVHVRDLLGDTLGSGINTGIAVSGTCLFVRTDGNADGLDDIGCVTPGSGLTIYPHYGSGTIPDLLASVTDGFGVTFSATYTAIERSNYSAYNNAVYPYRDVTADHVVVKKVTAPDGIGGSFDTDYTYFGAVVNLQGRGFQGFQKIESVDSRNGIKQVRQFTREFPYAGMPIEEAAYQSDGTLISKQTFTPGVHVLDATANNQRYFPYPASRVSDAYEVGGTRNGAWITRSTQSNTFDTWGNLTGSTSEVTDQDTSSSLYGQYWTTVNTTTITPDSGTNWCLGLPSSISTTRYSSVYGESTVSQSKGFSTDYANCRHTADAVGSGNLQVDTSYGFDGFGNVTSASVTGRNPNGSNMTVRTVSTTYDATGRFPISETNALGQTASATYHATFGSLLTATDANGIVVANNEYDAFGRLTRTTRADGTSTSYVLYECATLGSCVNANNKLEFVTIQRDTSGTQFRDESTYLDKFDRPIRTVSRLMNGSYSQVDREYDSLGRVQREGAPCQWASCSAYWVTNTYDLAGRVITQSRPQSQSVSTPVTTTFSYAGREQKITDPQGKQTIKILDAVGQMRRAQDHDGYHVNFQFDAAGSLKKVVDANSRELFSANYVYGIAPFQTDSTDMDMGYWTYTTNSLGERVAWTDAKGQSFSQTHDLLSRPLVRTEAEGTTTFTYGTSAASHNIGQLASVSLTDASTGYSESLSYDSIGRLSTRSITTDQTYAIDYAYTNQGLVDTVTYPVSTSSTRVKVKYGYQYGILSTVTDWTAGSAGTVYWTANAQNARGQVTQETLGNGVVTNRNFDAVTGWLNSIQSGVGGGTTLQNLSYLYDLIGNVTQRQESTQGLTENFYYDNLYRLSSSALNGTTNLTMAYDALGRITQRSDVNGNATWTYHSTKQHAVTSTGSGGQAFTYDANGNMTARGTGNAIAWTSYNYMASITTATESSQFYYGPDRRYYKQIYSGPSGNETTHYVGGILEKVYNGSLTDWRHSIVAGGQVVAIVSRKSSGTNDVYYPLEDSQGSGSTLTSSTGANLARQSYTAFGLPRDGSDWDGAVSTTDKATINGISRRGYTGHSMLGDMGLIHMNGRVQDAILGRFLSPDPNVPYPDNTQSYNRYSYVRNNPMSFIDPSGFEETAMSRETLDQMIEICRGANWGNSGSEAWCSSVEGWIMGYIESDRVAADYAAMDSLRDSVMPLAQAWESPPEQEDELAEVVITANRSDAGDTERPGLRARIGSAMAQVGNALVQVGHSLTAWHFEGRAARNGAPIAYDQVTELGSGWQQLSASQAIYHDNGEGLPELKFIHPSGREIVFDGDSFLPITEPRYAGTYNYVNPAPAPENWYNVGGWLSFVGRGIAHVATDVVPYWLGGNVRGKDRP